MMNGKSVGVIIPALNEALSIKQVLQDVPAVVDYVLVVDNGSTDQTSEVALSAGAIVINQTRKGYGSACLAGIAYFEKSLKPDLVAFIDADYSDYPADLEKIISPVARGDNCLAIGVRQPDQCMKSGLALHQRAGNWVACVIISVLHGIRFDDLGPMRCIDRRLLTKLKMVDPDYGWTAEMQIKALHFGIEVKQVPVRYRQRIGKSKISGTVKGSIMAAYKIAFWTFKLWTPVSR